jgi:hypothetical protein
MSEESSSWIACVLRGDEIVCTGAIRVGDAIDLGEKSPEEAVRVARTVNLPVERVLFHCLDALCEYADAWPSPPDVKARLKTVSSELSRHGAATTRAVQELTAARRSADLATDSRLSTNILRVEMAFVVAREEEEGHVGS